LFIFDLGILLIEKLTFSIAWRTEEVVSKTAYLLDIPLFEFGLKIVFPVLFDLFLEFLITKGAMPSFTGGAKFSYC
jgi:hypothetical protein